jgi:hypothetical protein
VALVISPRNIVRSSTDSNIAKHRVPGATGVEVHDLEVDDLEAADLEVDLEVADREVADREPDL